MVDTVEAKTDGPAAGTVEGVPGMDAVEAKEEGPAAGTVEAMEGGVVAGTVEIMEDCQAAGTVEAMDTVEAGPVTDISGLCGWSVTRDGAKSASLSISLLKGQMPVHLKPAWIFDGVAAIGKESLTIAGTS